MACIFSQTQSWKMEPKNLRLRLRYIAQLSRRWDSRYKRTVISAKFLLRRADRESGSFYIG